MAKEKKFKFSIKNKGASPTAPSEIEFFSKTVTQWLKSKAVKGQIYDIWGQQEGFENQYIGNYKVDTTTSPPPPPDHICPQGQHWDVTVAQCVPDVITPPPIECPPGQHLENGVCVPDVVTPPEPTGDVLYDSLTDSNLHDGIERTVTKEGNISPGGKGIECRASGNPRIHVNPDKTFSLLCDAGHGRIYGYVKNYNSTLEVEAAWWNEVKGQDCSQKERSQHNEKKKASDPQSLSDCSGDAFGGYGFSFDRTTYNGKREPEHNFHDQSKGGSLGMTLKTQEYWKSTFTVKDEANGVRQIGTVNGKEVMNKLDSSPLAWMKDPARYAQQSYFWIRQNIESGTGELRIKRVRVLKA